MRSNQIFIILSAFCFGALVAIWLFALQQGNQQNNTVSTGKPLIGGPFTLLDHNGKTTSHTSFNGQFKLIYFGYSFCPDICPTDLQKMSRALELIGGKINLIQPLFITIDPERDTQAQLKSYVSNFHPKLIGLTGTPRGIESVKKAYKIYGAKVDENGKPSKSVTGNNYLMDHSPQTFLMGPTGSFIRYFRFSTTAEEMARSIIKTVDNAK